MIDLEKIFTEKHKQGVSLNSKVDGHWDESGHRTAYDEILKTIKLISKINPK